jgi:drug/metabolite transporter (DMT)-like permease
MTARPLPATDAQALPMRKGLLAGNLLAAASMAVWAAGFPAAEGLLDTWHPFALVPARFAMALLLLLPIWIALEGWPRGLPWGRCLWIGGLGLGGAAVALIFAQSVTDPVTVAVIASVSPLTATLVEWVLERRPLTRSFLWGLVASVVGGVVATMGGGAGEGHLLLGAALAVGSCLLYSWGSHETVRSLPGRSALAQTSAVMVGAWVATLAVLGATLALGQTELPAEPFAPRDLGLLAVYGMGGMAISQFLFILGVRRIGVALASFHINVAPFYVMLIMVALGGDWSWMQALGAAIVAGGVLLAQR